MSFTQDELQAFNSILEERLTAQRRELERTFDQRISTLKQDFEQRLDSLQQDIEQSVSSRLAEQQDHLHEVLDERLHTQQTRLSETIQREHGELQQQQQGQFEDLVERAMAAQLLALEQLFNRHQSHVLAPYEAENGVSYQDDLQPQSIEAIEVQTEIPWDDLVAMFNTALDERMTHFNTRLAEIIHTVEQNLLTQMRTMLQNAQISLDHTYPLNADGNMQEVLAGIEQLEQIVESLQVAMTANQAFLSNRLFHHQNLPLERAHPASAKANTAPIPVITNGLPSKLSSYKEPKSEG